MNRFSQASVFCLIPLVLFLFVSCGGGQKVIDEARARIVELEKKGADNRLISDAKVLLSNIEAAKRIGNSKEARKNTDSLLVTLEKAEQSYASAMENAKPAVEKALSDFREKKSALSGMHLASADSVLEIIDSLVEKNWYIQAKERAEEFDTLLATLRKQEQTAQKTKRRVTGTWRGVMEAKGPGQNAVEKSRFTFYKNGKLFKSQEMKGQTSEFQKEDWKFNSWGTWQLKADTIYMTITRDKCLRQTFWNKDPQTNRWKKNQTPTYDSTLATPKTEIITYADLKDIYRK